MREPVSDVLVVLAALAELTAELARAEDVAAIGNILARSTKWVLPVRHASIVVRQEGDSGYTAWPSGAQVVPTGALATVLERQASLVVSAGPDDSAPVRAPGVEAWMYMPLVDVGEWPGVIALGARDATSFARMDSGACHLLALNVASAVRGARLLRRERAAREAAEQASRSRDLLIAGVTHDLRNPLTVAMSTVELVAEDCGPLAADLAIATASLRRVRSMIDELLDVACIQSAGQIVLQRRACHLRALVTEAAASARASLKPGHRLRVAITDEPLSGRFDEARLARVLGNLVSNAVKYSPAGGEIEITAERVTVAEQSIARVRVTDSGIGIPARDLPFVFERFRRAGNVGAISGTGVGLATSREIVLRHGGALDVTSVEGQGSTFTLELPLES